MDLTWFYHCPSHLCFYFPFPSLISCSLIVIVSKGFDCPAQWMWLEEACSSSTGLTSKFKPTVSGAHCRPTSSGFRRPVPLLLSIVIAYLFLVYPLRVMNVASYFTEKKEPSRGKLPILSSTPACQSYLLPVSCFLLYTWRICLF